MRGHASRSAAPPLHESVHETLRAPGRPLDQPVRAHFESRFHHDFSRVRVHAGGDAARSAQALRARAYTAGSHIVFGANEYDPASRDGHRLLAHEMGHVVQQEGARLGNDLAVEKDPQTIAPLHRETASIMRAEPDAVRQISKLKRAVGAGIHFYPETLFDTKIGPVTARSTGSNRLSVIIGEGLSPRVLARQILPLWTIATAFWPPGLPPTEPGKITEEQLAQALLVWNDVYLGLPNMNRWKVGLRLPLPIDLDDAGMGTVNPDQIRFMASTFDPTKNDILDHRATTNVELPAPILFDEARLFLAAHQDAFARGLAITVRATTNAPASHRLIAEVFRQLSPVTGLEVALEAIENMRPQEMAMLANQTAGGQILDALDDAISKPRPVPEAFKDRQARARGRLDQFNIHMLNDPPSKVPDRAEKTVTVDTLRVGATKFIAATQVQVANAIFAQCNVKLVHRVDKDAPSTFLGTDQKLHVAGLCGSATKEERDLFQAGRRDYGMSARIRAYFIPAFREPYKDSAYSIPRSCESANAGTTVISNSSDHSTLAHEIGHILLDPGWHKKDTVMGERPRPNEIDEGQCKRIYRNA